MNRINNNFNNNNNNKTMDTNSTVTRKPRTKLKAINNFLMCCLCKGYIVEATAITDCLHSCEYFSLIFHGLQDLRSRAIKEERHQSFSIDYLLTNYFAFKNTSIKTLNKYIVYSDVLKHATTCYYIDYLAYI